MLLFERSVDDMSIESYVRLELVLTGNKLARGELRVTMRDGKVFEGKATEVNPRYREGRGFGLILDDFQILPFADIVIVESIVL